jgi:glycerol-3-phosphate dehydrogenase
MAGKIKTDTIQGESQLKFNIGETTYITIGGASWNVGLQMNVQSHPRLSAIFIMFSLYLDNPAALQRPLTADDVIGTYAGLRPLVGEPGGQNTADISRRHLVERRPPSYP